MVNLRIQLVIDKIVYNFSATIFLENGLKFNDIMASACESKYFRINFTGKEKGKTLQVKVIIFHCFVVEVNGNNNCPSRNQYRSTQFVASFKLIYASTWLEISPVAMIAITTEVLESQHYIMKLLEQPMKI